MSSIFEWLKENFKWFVFIFLALLLLSLSFGLGYLISEKNHPAPIIIEKCSDSSSQ